MKKEAFVRNLKEHFKKAKDIKLTSVYDILSIYLLQLLVFILCRHLCRAICLGRVHMIIPDCSTHSMLSPFFERFFKKSGPRGARQKKLQN